MKGLLGLVSLLSIAVGEVSAHYIWTTLDIGSQKGTEFEGVRKNTNNNSPVTDLTSLDLRCNEGGLDGSQTSVREIQAGEEFTFHTDIAVYHQGPISVFLSKAPSSVQDYEGDGKWAKVVDIGPDFSSGSATWQMEQSYTFTLPTCLPDGEYLLRVQSLGIHNPYPAGIPQFYVGCGQIKVTGGTNTDKWNPTLSIPGVFKETDPGYTANIYNPDFKSYTPPGGSAMTC